MQLVQELSVLRGYCPVDARLALLTQYHFSKEAVLLVHAAMALLLVHAAMGRAFPLAPLQLLS